jgi:hypothetical protein
MREENRTQLASPLVVALIMFGSSFAKPAAAQSTISASMTPPGGMAPLLQSSQKGCYCGKAAPGGTDQCHVPVECPIESCDDDLDCDPGDFCLSDQSCCGISVCVESCSECTLGVGEGICGSFVACAVSSAPTLSQWGLVVLALFMIGAAGWTSRREGTAARTAIFGSLGVGLVTVAMAYAVIQRNRPCETRELTAIPFEQILAAEWPQVRGRTAVAIETRDARNWS